MATPLTCKPSFVWICPGNLNKAFTWICTQMLFVLQILILTHMGEIITALEHVQPLHTVCHPVAAYRIGECIWFTFGWAWYALCLIGHRKQDLVVLLSNYTWLSYESNSYEYDAIYSVVCDECEWGKPSGSLAFTFISYFFLFHKSYQAVIWAT